MQDRPTTPERGEPNFRRTLIQVLIVQVVALALLGFLQIFYNA